MLLVTSDEQKQYVASSINSNSQNHTIIKHQAYSVPGTLFWENSVLYYTSIASVGYGTRSFVNGCHLSLSPCAGYYGWGYAYLTI